MRLLTAVALSTVLFAGQAANERKLTKEQGEQFQTKLGRIVKTGETPRSKSRAAQSTQITDAELNSYLRFQAADQLPSGIVDPMINAEGESKVSGSEPSISTPSASRSSVDGSIQWDISRAACRSPRAAGL